MKIIKKKTKKIPLFPKNFVHFVFLQMRWNECERGKQDFSNKMIVLNATSVLIFQYKKSLKRYYTIGLFQLLQRQICEGDRYFP